MDDNDGTLNTLINPPPVLSSISLDSTAYSITQGNTHQSVIAAVYSDGSKIDVSNFAAYTSSNQGVATVNPSGLVTATGVGQSVITAVYGGQSVTATVTVVQAPITTGTITGTVTDGNRGIAGATVSLTVGGFVYSATTASDGSYSILNIPAGTGYFITGSKAGYNNGTVTANVTANTTTSGVNITIAPVLSSIALGSTTYSTTVGSTYQTLTTATYSDGTKRDVTKFASYTSSNTGVATVNLTGLVTAVGAGQSVITAVYGGQSATITITVIIPSWNGNSSGNIIPAPTQTPTTVTSTSSSGVVSTITVDAKSDASGKASAAVTESQVAKAVTDAIQAAASQGQGAKANVEIKVTAPADAKTVEASLPKAAVAAVVENKADSVMLSTPVADITFDKTSLGTISQEVTGDVKINASKVDSGTLSEQAKQTVGDRPVFNFSVTSGDKTISQFGGGNVTVSVPYAPKAGEDTNAIVIYYINAQGQMEIVNNCAYDPATKMITFKTNHFSTYAVGYNKVSFKDFAPNAWYSKSVTFMAARGITNGTGDGNYSPYAELTRGQFIVMTMRAYGISPDTNQKDNFTDAGNTYYTGYLAAAKHLGISQGVGKNMFAPNTPITRQEMFTLLYNILKSVSELPVSQKGTELSAFSDANKIAPWAKDAMTLFVKTGTVSGSDGNLNPGDTSNRAQMAQVLYNLLSK